MQHEKAYLRDTELADRFGVTRTTIWRWVERGDFPEPVRLSAKCTRWPSDAVDAWEASRAERAEA